MSNNAHTLEGSDGADDNKFTTTSISGDGGQVYNNCTFNYLCPEYQCKNAPEQKHGSVISLLASLVQFFIKMA